MAVHYSTWTYLDASNEKSTVRVFNGAVTAVSIGGFLTAFGVLRDAIDAITLCTRVAESWVGDQTDFANTLPTSPYAQRELKAVFTYQGDTSQKLFQFSIPGPDLAYVDAADEPFLLPGTDIINLANDRVAALIAAFDPFARTPDNDAETVTLLSGRIAGRNI